MIGVQVVVVAGEVLLAQVALAHSGAGFKKEMRLLGFGKADAGVVRQVSGELPEDPGPDKLPVQGVNDRSEPDQRFRQKVLSQDDFYACLNLCPDVSITQYNKLQGG